VEARVRELADRLQRELVELEDLPRSREVEEAVSLDRPRDPPQEDPEGGARSGGRPAPGDPLVRPVPSVSSVAKRPKKKIRTGMSSRACLLKFINLFGGAFAIIHSKPIKGHFLDA